MAKAQVTSRAASVRVPLTKEQQKKIYAASGQNVSEIIIMGESEKGQPLSGESPTPIDRLVGSRLAPKTERLNEADTPGFAKPRFAIVR